MTLGNVGLIRNAYEAYISGDTSILGNLVDPDLEWTFLDPSEEDPKPQVCHGSEQLIYWMTRRRGQDVRPTLEEVTEYGECVLVVTRMPVVDTTYAQTLDKLRYHVLTVRGGRILALRACRNQQEALSVAGADRCSTPDR